MIQISAAMRYELRKKSVSAVASTGSCTPRLRATSSAARVSLSWYFAGPPGVKSRAIIRAPCCSRIVSPQIPRAAPHDLCGIGAARLGQKQTFGHGGDRRGDEHLVDQFAQCACARWSDMGDVTHRTKNRQGRFNIPSSTACHDRQVRLMSAFRATRHWRIDPSLPV